VEAPRSTFEATWDYVQFPTDTEVEPSLVSSGSWVWPGDIEDAWSEYFTIPLPTVPGEVRRVNLRILCFRCTRTGQKPTAIGEEFEITA
jgi:hypothetical protein